jgi:pimeloyl-ACP methyl ester carboxylesterase
VSGERTDQGPTWPGSDPVTGSTLEGAGGLRLAADELGDPSAPPVVLLHGGGQTRHSWHTTARALADRGWHAYSVDLRGHGESEWAVDGDYRIDSFVADVAAIVAGLPEPPALVGASLGGVASLVAVGEGTPARALVLVDVAPRIEPAGAQRIGDFMRAHMEDGFASLEEVADAVSAYNPHRPRPTDLSGLRRNLRRREDGRLVWHWDPRFMERPGGHPDETRASLVPPERLQAAARALRIPTLLVRGRMSDVLSEDGAREFMELVPHAQFLDVAGAGHMVAGDRNDAFNAAIVEFLSAQAH